MEKLKTAKDRNETEVELGFTVTVRVTDKITETAYEYCQDNDIKTFEGDVKEIVNQMGRIQFLVVPDDEEIADRMKCSRGKGMNWIDKEDLIEGMADYEDFLDEEEDEEEEEEKEEERPKKTAKSKAKEKEMAETQVLPLEDQDEDTETSTEKTETKAKRKIAEISSSIVREGDKLILPKGSSYKEIIGILTEKEKEDNSEVAISETIDCHPADGAYALLVAMKEVYGVFSPKERNGFFGPTPPKVMDIEIDYNKTVHIIWGDFSLPGISGRVQTGATISDEGMLMFQVNAVTKKKYENKIRYLAERVRQIVHTNSIYKGKAIRLMTTEEGKLDMAITPKFLDLSNATGANLTFSDELSISINVNIFTLIEKTEKCRKEGIPLKRGILLEGPYGTGKTLTAFVTAQKCVENGWTFLYVDRVQGLKSAFSFAKRYAPAVIFAEDIDRVLDSGNRTLKIDDVLNSIDGIDAKSFEIMTVFTTNHVENISKGMMRPGRLDAVIHVGPPDAKAAERLIRNYSIEMLEPGIELNRIGKAMEGKIPAIIREVTEKAKLYAISRSDAEKVFVNEDDLLHAANVMNHHIELLEGTPKKEETAGEKIANAISSIVQEKTDEVTGKVEEVLEKI